MGENENKKQPNKFNSQYKSFSAQNSKSNKNVDLTKIKQIEEQLNKEYNKNNLQKNDKASRLNNLSKTANSLNKNKDVQINEHIKNKNEKLIQQLYLKDKLISNQNVKYQTNKFNITFIVLTILLSLCIIIMGVYLYLEKQTRYDKEYLKVSVSMVNKELFFTNVQGELIPKDVSPGDSFELKIDVNNSNLINGDAGKYWANIYVRFKIFVKVEGKEYPEFIYLEPNEIWETYDKTIEDGYIQSENNPKPVVTESDGYYYCRTVLEPNKKVRIIEKIRFNENAITEIVGGKNAFLEVRIEALDASNPAVLANRTVWQNAPQHWVEYMTDENNFPQNPEKIPYEPNKPANNWYILGVVILICLIMAMMILLTTKRFKSNQNVYKLHNEKSKKKKYDDKKYR